MEKATGRVLVFHAIQTNNRQPGYSMAVAGTGVVGKMG